MRAIDHPALRGYLGLADRCARFNIDDDGALQVDQVGGAIGEEGQSVFNGIGAFWSLGRPAEVRL